MKLLIANKKNAAVFVSIFNHLTKFSDSLNIVFNTDNMYIQGMDSSHVSMFEIRIFSDWFESYKCEKSMTIGVPTGILYKVLNAGDENQLLFLEYEEDSDKLGINFKNLKADQKYFPKEFEIPLTYVGTKFQRSVWAALSEIPYGQTVSYSEIAEEIGNAHGVRAVASAISRNPISVVIPCHRVISKNGCISGYAGGIERKLILLKLEKGC